MRNLFKILLCDKLSPSISSSLSPISQLYNLPTISDLKSTLLSVSPSIIVVRSTKLSSDLLSLTNNLKLIVRAGSGIDTIDVPYCTKQGIYVANCPGRNANAVAELVFALMLGIDRKIPQNYNSLKNNVWDKGSLGVAIGLKDRKLGIFGFGAVGKAVGRIGLGFGMKVSIHDKMLIGQTLGSEWNNIDIKDNIEEFIQESDIISLHVPSNKETKGLVNKNFLEKMKKNAILINTSRGDIINEPDLLDFLNRNKDFYAGLDVFGNEPGFKKGEFVNNLAKHERVFGSCHIGASTHQAEEDVAFEAKKIIEEYILRGRILNCVNKELLKN